MHTIPFDGARWCVLNPLHCSRWGHYSGTTWAMQKDEQTAWDTNNSRVMPERSQDARGRAKPSLSLWKRWGVFVEPDGGGGGAVGVAIPGARQGRRLQPVSVLSTGVNVSCHYGSVAGWVDVMHWSRWYCDQEGTGLEVGDTTAGQWRWRRLSQGECLIVQTIMEDWNLWAYGPWHWWRFTSQCQGNSHGPFSRVVGTCGGDLISSLQKSLQEGEWVAPDPSLWILFQCRLGLGSLHE